jgi:hypothetical protein
MPRRLLSKTADASRDKLFWLTASAMVFGQLVAFWMLCSDQVRTAEARDATVRVERMAVADCLRHTPQATLNSCSARLATNGSQGEAGTAAMHASGGAAPAMMSSVVPVNYVYR